MAIKKPVRKIAPKTSVKKHSSKASATAKKPAKKAAKQPKGKKYVYIFGAKTEGNASMKNLLGGKGANLAEMCLLDVPVPAGFTVSTECCTDYYEGGCKLPAVLTSQVLSALSKTEAVMGMKYGESSAGFLSLRRAQVHAGYDGHRAQCRSFDGNHSGDDSQDEQPALCLGFLPPSGHDVRRCGDGKGRGP